MRRFAVLLFSAALAAQPPDTPAFKTGAGEVLVDVVVRSKTGRIARKLTASDFTVLENNVPQQITSFRQVGVSAGRPPAEDAGEITTQSSSPGANDLKVQRQLRLVSLVFSNLDTEARRNARTAALEFLEADYGPNVYYAVFYISRTFKPLLSYTNNLDRIKQAINVVTNWERSSVSNPADVAMGREPTVLTPVYTPQSETGPGPNFEATIAAMNDFNRRMDLNMFGAIGIFGLWGIIDELGRLPGRKSVILFSTGLQLPFDYRQHYLSMVSAANRNNVSFYTIDARGLTTDSDMMAVRRDLDVAVSTTQDVTTRNAMEGSGMWGRREMGFDRAMQSIYNHDQQNLFDLSERTGGFLIANTNDFRKGIRKIAEEFNSYYEITYRPANLEYDGRFRAIAVKVRDQGLRVQARDGYFAIPPMQGQAVFPFEVPLLHALGRATLPKDLEFRSRVLLFQETGGQRKASLVFDLPLHQVTFMKNEVGTRAKTYTSFLALVKDDQGHVVTKLSRDLPVEVPLDKVAEFKRGRSIFTRPFYLAPGRYTLESVLSDNISGKLAAKRSVLVVPASTGGPRMSDLALVRNVEALPDPIDPADPLQLAAGRVVPTLEDDFVSGSGGQIAPFVMLFPDASSPAPQLFFDLLRDGKLVRREQPSLPADENGAVPVIARVSTAGLPPGQYELRAALVQGDKATARTLPLTIQ